MSTTSILRTLLAAALLTACASEAETPRAQDESQTTTAGLDEEVIQGVVRDHRADIKTCYEAALGDDPALAGSLTVRFTIADDGHVVSAEPAEDTLQSAPLRECIIDEAITWTFPAPEDQVVVNYPFTFSPE